MYGRGATDDKGPALSWLWVIQAHQKLGVDLPVNVKLMFEGMEESGSDGMFEAIQILSEEGKFLSDGETSVPTCTWLLTVSFDLSQPQLTYHHSQYVS